MTYEGDNALAPKRGKPWQGAVEAPAKLIATAGFAGYAPIAPGTAGTAVTIPLAWALAGVGLPIYLTIVVGVIVLGIAVAAIVDRAWGTHDSGRIVIDE